MNVSYENQNFSDLEERLQEAEGTPQRNFRSLRTRVLRDAVQKKELRQLRWKQTFGLAAAVLLAFGLGRYSSPNNTIPTPSIVEVQPDVIDLENESVQESAQKTVVKIEEVPNYTEEYVKAVDDFSEEIRQLRSHRRKILIGIQGRL